MTDRPSKPTVDMIHTGLSVISATLAQLGSPELLLLLVVSALCFYYQQSFSSSRVSPPMKCQRSPCTMNRHCMSRLGGYLILALAVGPASCIVPDHANMRQAGLGASHRETDETIPVEGINNTPVNHESILLRISPSEEYAALASNPFIPSDEFQTYSHCPFK